jgi:hypothetical protein
MKGVDSRSGFRELVDAPLRGAWLTLLVPTGLAIKFTLGDFQPWPDYPIAWLIHFVIFACILVPIQMLYSQVPDRLKPTAPFSWQALAFHVAVIGIWGAAGAEIGSFLASPLYPPISEDPTDEWRGARGVIVLGFWFLSPVAFRGMRYRERLVESRTREIAAQREALAAQVQALQARIQPHFLFNSLNAVASLIPEDAVRAERALEKIAGLFRYALDASDQPFVPLADELASVESFLELEALRFPDRLSVAQRIETGVGDVPLPPLFLQPLVENAVQHGVASQRDGGRVEVEIGRSETELAVCVEDDGPGPGGSNHRGAGSALADLRKRLALLYGEAAGLEVDRGPLGGCRVRVRIPIEARGWPAPGVMT